MAYYLEDKSTPADLDGLGGSHGPSIVGTGWLVFFAFLIWTAKRTLKNHRAGLVARDQAAFILILARYAAYGIGIWYGGVFLWWLIR